MPEAAIRPLGTLHLTLGVMSLLTPERVNAALALLKSLKLADLMSLATAGADSKEGGEQKVSGQSLSFDLRGLKSMHEPSQTSILYTSPVDADLRLQAFCTSLRDAFLEAGFLVHQQRPLLLHATIVNMVYVQGGRAKGAGGGKRKIDAREIMGRYEDFEWASSIWVEKVAICKMGAEKDDHGNEEYVVEGAVGMPK